MCFRCVFKFQIKEKAEINRINRMEHESTAQEHIPERCFICF